VRDRLRSGESCSDSMTKVNVLCSDCNFCDLGGGISGGSLSKTKYQASET
jgi:hypothetical protein